MIDKSLLKPGDILLFKPKSIFHVSAWFISWGENVMGKTPHDVSYCHVALVDFDTTYLLEARWPKSHRVTIDWNKLNAAYTVELWRVKDVSLSQISDAIDWGHKNVGEWYDIGLFLWGWVDEKHEEVCSTFVAKAWADAGIIFKQVKKVGVGTLITPDEIAGNTDLIERIA